MLLKLEQLQQDQIEAATQSPKPVELSENEKRAAHKFLQDPNLIDQILLTSTLVDWRAKRPTSWSVTWPAFAEAG